MRARTRLQSLQEEIPKHKLDAILVGHLPNIRYLCGFSGSAGLLVVSDREIEFFTDGRYTVQAREEVKGARIRIQKGKSAFASALDWLTERKRIKRLGIEAANMTVADRQVLATRIGRGIRIMNAPSLIERMRMVKSDDEIAKIRAACELGSGLLDELTQALKPGRSESQVAGQLELGARNAGADQMAFTTIIAGGKRSTLPHGRASSAPIPDEGFVVCDFGVILSGYCSDMTRTLHVGRPSAGARRVYEAVREAQQAALEAVRPGKIVGEVDAAARKLLHKRGLGKYFTHSTGHGLGLEIHEAPRVAAGQTEILRPGVVITVEPGVYLPGQFGVRIEDTVVVTETGCEILTECPKELLSV
ncbi:MAG TPA: Xaa-Pro peptidase family protein [Terriglobales bacterium]|nr:Xaa-Pro peptidase family protein [Terriglobales bacterium]